MTPPIPSSAGALLLAETAQTIGLSRALSAELAPWRSASRIAAALAGCDLQEPTILPEGFAFKYTDYDAQARRIRMVYEFGSQSGVAGLIIFQTPIMAAIDINLADGRTPGTVEQVAIGTTTGHYVPRAGGAPQALVWRTNDLQIEMYFFPSQWYGGRLEKADMVAIAESMK